MLTVGVERLSAEMELETFWEIGPHPGSIVESMDTTTSRTQQVRSLIDRLIDRCRVKACGVTI